MSVHRAACLSVIPTYRVAGFQIDKKGGHALLRNTMRIASNKLTGSPTPLVVEVPTVGTPSIRLIWKAIREIGTIFQG
jgi:hypothetical protein